MKTFIIFSVCFSLAAAAAAVVPTAPCDPCSCCDEFGNVYTPDYDQSQCHKYTHAYNSVSGLKTCPPGTVFDINTCVCNWPSASAPCTCEGAATTVPDNTTSEVIPEATTEPIRTISSEINVLELHALIKASKFSPKSQIVDRCTCFEKGNFYSPISSEGCASFLQRTAYLPAQRQPCPAGLIFDVAECVCNRPEAATCPAGCQDVKPPTDVSGGSCERRGNTYRQKPETDCTQFTQETATLPAQTHNCPTGLQFDLVKCVCNWPRDTVCHV